MQRLSSSLNLSKTLRGKGTVEAMGNQIIIKEIIELWKVQVVDLPASCTRVSFASLFFRSFCLVSSTSQ